MSLKNLLFFTVGIVSSVSARKLKCPSSARLGTFIARARSRAGKIQLEVITRKYVLYLKVANLEISCKVQVKLNIQKTRLAIK